VLYACVTCFHKYSTLIFSISNSFQHYSKCIECFVSNDCPCITI